MTFGYFIRYKNNNYEGALELSYSREEYSFEDPPYQEKIEEPIIQFKGFNVKPLAKFSANLKVLGVKNYSSGKEGELSPVDFAVGWGVMKNEENLKHLKISQGERWFFVNFEKENKLPSWDIMGSAANIHIVPKSDYIEKLVKEVEPGDEIEIGGRLILVTTENWRWVSSTTRNDTGAGSCEILLVDYINIKK